MSLPQISLAGNLVADCELRFTNQGKAICKARVAANDRRRNDAGEWVDAGTTFLDLTMFGAVAEAAAEVCLKGVKVVVTGRLQQSEWTDSKGEKRVSFAVLVDSIGIQPGAKANRASGPTADPWAAAEAPSQGFGSAEPPF